MRLLGLLITMVILVGGIAFAADQAKPDSGKPETGRWVVIETSKGTVKFALYEKDAPNTTKNFVELVERKFYDGLKFHRVVPGFVVQGGDPKGDGSGQSEKTIKLEVSPKLKHDDAGVVAMARRNDPDSASCQFYITLGPASWLDMGYAVFGRVTEGLDVVKRLEVGDVMKTVRIIPAPCAEKPAAKAPASCGKCCP
ncbi:MAG: peptidylprolyl isomerase [Chloroflexi bacterium]|nr:peptidylprolyl isomerase [Chloroflexota bacterium]MCL5103875.1 peptidylprolyl isomerase [Armatimonadota bacterium]